jgi:hypothetical protein
MMPGKAKGSELSETFLLVLSVAAISGEVEEQ